MAARAERRAPEGMGDTAPHPRGSVGSQVTHGALIASATEAHVRERPAWPFTPYGKRETRCALCNDTGRVLAFPNGRQCAWFEGYGLVYSSGPKARPCTHTLSGTLGNKRQRRKLLLDLAASGKVILSDNALDAIDAQKEL